MKLSRNILVVEVLHDSLYDESGVVCYEYGNMGEVTQETRIYALPFLSSPLALSTQFEYDSWGRIQDITYPDNEVVSYGYDLGGQLQSITNNSSYTYLDNVSYDRFGAKVSQTYGNGITTDYSYNNVTRRLSTITTLNGNSQISTFAYTYDPVGNVTQVASSYSWLNNQSFTESFTYDASDQLTTASETQAQSYSLSVSYDDWGKVNNYDLTQTDNINGTTTQDNRLFTYPSDPNSLQDAQTFFAPAQCNGTTDVLFTFGINGSLRKREVQGVVPHTEHYLFNSAANLKAYSNNLTDFAYYGYNASNTRAYKLGLSGSSQWVNGQQQSLHLGPQQAMFYPNAYINFNQNGEYTKHYYNGAERIASRLGDVNLSIAFDYDDMLETHRAQIEERFRLDMQALLNEEVPVDNLSMLDVSSLQQTGSPDDIFYYHTNHLGSTAYVTDQSQNITQGFLYAPFGEITTEYNTTFGNDIIPKYSFNAKELDEETGMYYYEARYYKPPVFTSRDAMMDQKPWLTPYAYCRNNPVVFVDPNGNDEWEINSSGNVVKHIKTKEHDAFYMVDNDGNRIEGKSCEFSYGTIEKHFQRSYERRGDKGVYDVFQVRGDDNGEKLFEFFANAVVEQEMEVSHIKCGIEGDKGLNFVSTAHFKSYTETREDGKQYRIASEPSFTYLWNGRLQYGYTIRAINHSHPLSADPSDSDLRIANQIRQIYSDIKKTQAPSFNIFYVKENRYIPF